MEPDRWLCLTYKVPPEPAKRRISLWRKLRGMGAIYIQDGVCLLPATDDHRRALKILHRDISDMGGEGLLLEVIGEDERQRQAIRSRFNRERDALYQEFLGRCRDFEAEIASETEQQHFTYAELEENDKDLKKLQGWLQDIQQLDFYGAPLSAKALERLSVCEELLEAFANTVFAADPDVSPKEQSTSEEPQT